MFRPTLLSLAVLSLAACGGGTGAKNPLKQDTANNSEVEITQPVGNQAPVIRVVQKINALLGQETRMDASASSDTNGDTLTVAWQILNKPSGSNAQLSKISSLIYSLTPDVIGQYQVLVTLADAEFTSSQIISITAHESEGGTGTDSSNTQSGNNNSGSSGSSGSTDSGSSGSSSGSTDSGSSGSSSGSTDSGSSDSSGSTDSGSSGSSSGSTDSGTSGSSGNTCLTYSAGTTYVAGDMIEHNSSIYRCSVAGWCSSSAAFAYEPGVGFAWDSAWSLVQGSSCTGDTSGGTDSDNSGSTSDTSGGSTDSGSDSGSPGSTDTTPNPDWASNVDASGWPKALKNNNTAYNNNNGKVVGTYFVEWGVYGRNFHVADIPATNLTHILYGFIPVCGPNQSLQDANASGYSALVSQCAGKQNFEVTIHDKYAALEKSYPGDQWDDAIKGNFGQLMRMKKAQPNLKVLPSVGGWTLSDPFFYMDNSANRATFINSVKNFLREYPFFDGVDIDWEFPGGGGANASLGKNTDGETYATLMQELRTMLDGLETELGKKLELTSAIGTSPRFIDAVNYSKASQYMDYIFMMNYDFKGAWSSELGHQTNLHASDLTADKSLSVEIAVQKMLSKNVAPQKIVVGVAMYGRGWKNISGISGSNPFTGTGGGALNGTWEAGILDYKDIEANMQGGASGSGINGWTYHWDAKANAPYLYNANSKSLISYDDARSTKAKGQYVLDQNLGGVFSWEIDADTGTILNAMHEGLNHPKK